MKLPGTAGSTVLGTLATAVVLLLVTSTSAFAFTPGQNGAPTGGQHSDLQGRAGDVALAFHQNATIECSHLTTATTVNLKLDYDVQGDALPANSTVVVYVSPNDAAIDGNADTNNDGAVSGGEASAYVSDVESNLATVNLAGLSGSGTEAISIAVTSSFQLLAGGVMGVVASDLDGANPTVAFDAQSNSLNCLEAEGSPTPTPTASPSATPTPTPPPSETPTPEATPTAPQGNQPQPTPPDTDTSTMMQRPPNNVAGAVLLILAIGCATGALLLVRPMRIVGRQ
jgi:hypothetical protein